MADDRHSDLTVALAFIVGALAGAGIALLLAPKSGADLRAQVGEWIREMQEKAGEAMRGEDGDDDATAGAAGPGSRPGRRPSAV